jgi:hypothetical protein
MIPEHILVNILICQVLINIYTVYIKFSVMSYTYFNYSSEDIH